MSEIVRLALVGAGRMGRVHLQAAERARGVDVTAVVDPVDAARAALAATGMRTHPSVEELLAAGGFDAAVVAAPSELHVELVRVLATKGFPVLCEKPCGLSAEDVRAAAEAADAAGTLLQVGYWRRFVPALGRLRARIGDGGLGEVSFVSSYQWDEHPPSAAFRATSGGIVLDMGVHEFDQLRWLTGQEIGRLEAAAVVASDGAESAGFIAELSGGAIGVASLGQRFGLPDSCWVEVIGTRGHAREPFMWGAEGERVFLDAIAAQLEAFARAIGSGSTGPAATAEDAIAALEAAERAAEALAGARAAHP
jgi:myo-inositol 2-dehydrogenase/D-chiro-inositol 1-dehydrogenase